MRVNPLLFKDKDLAVYWEDPAKSTSKRLRPPMGKKVYRKLQMLFSAHALIDLTIPPGNRLERLRGDRADQYSIRVDGQWRLCFIWTEDGPKEVELCDYH